MFSFFGDTVLDPFCGTGTTMLAAMKTDRNSIGVEIDPMYCRMVMQRLEKETHPLFGSSSCSCAHGSTTAPSNMAPCRAPAIDGRDHYMHIILEMVMASDLRPSRADDEERAGVNVLSYMAKDVMTGQLAGGNKTYVSEPTAGRKRRG